MSNDEAIEAMRQRLVVQIFQATQTKVSADDPIVTAALIQGLFMREQSAIVAKEIAKAGADAVERINAATAASEDKLTVALGAAVKASQQLSASGSEFQREHLATARERILTDVAQAASVEVNKAIRAPLQELGSKASEAAETFSAAARSPWVSLRGQAFGVVVVAVISSVVTAFACLYATGVILR